MVLVLDGELWSVVEFLHVKPGKGPAFVRTKIKNVLSGKTVDRTFNAGVKVETATVDRRDMQYLYQDGTDFVFMDTDTYDQLRSEEHTSELQSRGHLVCRLLLEKKKKLETILYTMPDAINIIDQA